MNRDHDAWILRLIRSRLTWEPGTHRLPGRVRLVVGPDVSYYELPDGTRHPVPTNPHSLIAEYRRAEEMHGPGVTIPVAGFVREAMEGRRYDASDDPEVSPFARRRAKFLEGLQEVERFEWVIRHLEPAPSAWNPVTGLEPVLCRVCGGTSDPQTGRVLAHRDYSPCAPRVERPREDGITSEVRDVVLVRSANMREEFPAPRAELTPAEILSLSVAAYQTAVFTPGGPRPAGPQCGPVRECLACLAISELPGTVASHDDNRCAGADGYVVAEVDPREVSVAACHLPGVRSLTDPDWYHLAEGWWVAWPGTPAPGWVDSYVERKPLAQVADMAHSPGGLTPVRLNDGDRWEARNTAATLARLGQLYTQMAGAMETRHGVAPILSAIAAQVRHSWAALAGLHDGDGGILLHAALGAEAMCPVCDDRHPTMTPATERRMEALATAIHARMANTPGRSLSVRETWLILELLLQYRVWEDDESPGFQDFALAEDVSHQLNERMTGGTLRNPRRIVTADVGQVIRAYRQHVAVPVRADGNWR